MRILTPDRKIIQARVRIAGADPNVSIRAFKDAAGTVRVAESIIGNVASGVYYNLPLAIPTGNLWFRVWSIQYSAWYGPLSGALDCAHGTQLETYSYISGGWQCDYTASDPGGYTPISPPVIWLNDTGWDWFFPGEYGIATEFDFAGPLPVGAEQRTVFNAPDAGYPADTPSTWLPLASGSNYNGVSIGTGATEFLVTLWGEIRWNGIIYRGPSVTHDVQV